MSTFDLNFDNMNSLIFIFVQFFFYSCTEAEHQTTLIGLYRVRGNVAAEAC